ncbi:MAG TPA: hypothetical protein VMU84_19110 [Thermoanaerobaculia bacterium]|nr:hypothetical protein [Thermoanaerobaculia bacterium]
MLRRTRVLLAIALLIGCKDSPTEPTQDNRPRGRLAGVVTIGPNCPGPTTTTPCPTPPSAYAARKVRVYNETKSSLLFTVDIDSSGLYVIDLLPGKYTIDLQPFGIDHSAEVPAVVEIVARTVTTLDINIDTGLR